MRRQLLLSGYPQLRCAVSFFFVQNVAAGSGLCGQAVKTFPLISGRRLFFPGDFVPVCFSLSSSSVVLVVFNSGVGEFFEHCPVRPGIAPWGRKHLIESLTHGSDPAQVPLNQPQKADCHGQDYPFCLFGIGARVRGRAQCSVTFGYGPQGAIPGRTIDKS